MRSSCFRFESIRCFARAISTGKRTARKSSHTFLALPLMQLTSKQVTVCTGIHASHGDQFENPQVRKLYIVIIEHIVTLFQSDFRFSWNPQLWFH